MVDVRGNGKEYTITRQLLDNVLVGFGSGLLGVYYIIIILDNLVYTEGAKNVYTF